MPLNAATDFPNLETAPGLFSETDTLTDPTLPMSPAPTPAAGREDLADKFVKLAGYMTPFNVEGGKTRTFLLVPYVGACIHVPAPPANQIVLVESKEPVDVKDIWEPFEAIGKLQLESVSTALADVSYSMELDRIEPYIFEDEAQLQSD